MVHLYWISCVIRTFIHANGSLWMYIHVPMKYSLGIRSCRSEKTDVKKANRSNTHNLSLPSFITVNIHWILDVPQVLKSFGTMSLRRILGYRWHDYMSNDLVLREAGLRQVTCIVRHKSSLLLSSLVLRQCGLRQQMRIWMRKWIQKREKSSVTHSPLRVARGGYAKLENFFD